VDGALQVVAGRALGRECGRPVPDRRDGLVPGGWGVVGRGASQCAQTTWRRHSRRYVW